MRTSSLILRCCRAVDARHLAEILPRGQELRPGQTARHGAGSMPARLRSSHTVLGRAWTRPCEPITVMRRQPHVGSQTAYP